MEFGEVGVLEAQLRSLRGLVLRDLIARGLLDLGGLVGVVEHQVPPEDRGGREGRLAVLARVGEGGLVVVVGRSLGGVVGLDRAALRPEPQVGEGEVPAKPGPAQRFEVVSSCLSKAPVQRSVVVLLGTLSLGAPKGS